MKLNQNSILSCKYFTKNGFRGLKNVFGESNKPIGSPGSAMSIELTWIRDILGVRKENQLNFQNEIANSLSRDPGI